METNLSISIYRLESYNREIKLHTSFWHRLVWLVAGDQLLFIRSGYSFDTETFSGAGWVLLFNESFLTSFLQRYPDKHHSGLMAGRSLDHTGIPLSPALRTELNDMAILLEQAQQNGQLEMYLQSYADLILLNANQAYANGEYKV